MQVILSRCQLLIIIFEVFMRLLNSILGQTKTTTK